MDELHYRRLCCLYVKETLFFPTFLKLICLSYLRLRNLEWLTYFNTVPELYNPNVYLCTLFRFCKTVYLSLGK